MERESKRKAGAAMSPENDARSAKRQKLQGHNGSTAETPESATEAGLRFVETLRQARDKTGRHIATDFLTLPDKRQYPEYYQQIALPIALDTIEAKLDRREYPNLAAVESDVKRMVSNAKAFNEKNSSVYEDAERIRKTAFNWMSRHNPAYKTPGYVAVPTPIPTEAVNGNAVLDSMESSAVGDVAERLRRAAVTQQTPQTTRHKRSSTRDSAGPEQMEDPDFTGKTFQQAQEQIMTEMIKYKDPESDLEIFTPFVNLPSRSLTDYYQLTKHPVSLRSVQKKVRGVHGRNPPTNITDFKSWDAFEEEVSFIWRNCRHYNEDGSEMYNLAGEFENIFKQRLAEAKAKVEQPAQPTLKLKMSASAPKQSIKLRFGAKDSPAPQSGPGTPAGRDSSTPGIIVDSSALARQQKHVAAGMNGQTAADATARSASASTPNPSLAQPSTDGTQTMSAASPPLAPNGVKSEAPPRQSPALGSIRPSSAAPERSSVPAQTPQLAASAMPPPPSITPRPPSASPHPQTNNHAHPPPSYATAPFENKYRAPGKTAADAILPVLTINSHPQLKLPRPYRINIPASPTLNEQSITLTLPSMCHDLQLIPTLPAAVTSRPYRLFVTMNGYRMSEIVRPGGEKEKGRPLFEARLKPGEVTRFDVEVLAATPVAAASPSKGRGAEKEQVEWEKCTVFVYLMR